MASMNRNERAFSYALRIKKASNLSLEVSEIINEIDSLVWTKDNTPLTLNEKIAIAREIKRIFREGERHDGQIIVLESDNSGILDVIDNIENELNNRNK